MNVNKCYHFCILIDSYYALDVYLFCLALGRSNNMFLASKAAQEVHTSLRLLVCLFVRPHSLIS